MVRFVKLGSVLLAAALLAIPAANAHVPVPREAETFEGHGCGVDLGVLQAECFTGGDEGCGPDHDREYTAAVGPELQWIGEYSAFTPHSGCGLVFDDVAFDVDLLPLAVRLRTNGIAWPVLVYEVTLYADDVAVATALAALPPDVDTLVPFLATGSVPAGAHDLRLVHTVLEGPSYANAYVDFLAFAPDCVNTDPLVGAATGDGMLGGFTGWSDHAYALSTSASDPDGDPLRVEWAFTDGVVLEGAAVSRAFAEGATGATLRVVEDLGRCLTGFARVHEVPLAFTAFPGPEVALARLAPGTSCVDDRVLQTFAGPSLVAGRCRLEAVAATDPALASIGAGVVRLDGADLTAAEGTSLAVLFESAAHAAGTHTLEACFAFEGDVHERTFCSAEHTLLNVRS